MNGTLQLTDGPHGPSAPSAAGLPAWQELASKSESPDARVSLISPTGELIGHCALWWKESPLHEGQTVGAIGGFAAKDPSSAKAILGAAEARLREAGCTRAVGPMNGNTWRRYRYIIESNGRGPYLLEPRNPEAYPQWWRDSDYEPISYYSSSIVPLSGQSTVPAGLEECFSRNGIRVRAIDPARYEEELRAIHAISLTSFSRAFLYTPLDETEFIAAYSKVRDRIDPELVRIAEKDGVPCAFIFTIADLEAAARGEKPALVVKTLAVDPAARCGGLGSLLVDQVQLIAHRKGFTEAIHAMQNEANTVLRITGRHGGEAFRRYAVFSKPL